MDMRSGLRTAVYQFSGEAGKQIGRASCRERVLRLV